MTCGWYGKSSVRVGERPVADVALEELALADPGGQLHEHHRRDRPEGRRAAQLHVERVVLAGDLVQVVARRGRGRPGSSAVGGSSVTWVGIASASGSPNDARIDCSCEPYGSGIAIATPIEPGTTAAPVIVAGPESVKGSSNRASPVNGSPVKGRRSALVAHGSQCFPARKPTRS